MTDPINTPQEEGQPDNLNEQQDLSMDPPASRESLFSDTVTPYDPYAQGSFTGDMLYNNSKSDRDIIFEEAARASMDDEYLDKDGNWVPGDQLDLSFGRNENPEEERQAAKVTGFTEVGKRVADMMGWKEEDAQEIKNRREEYYGWIPTSGTVQSILFDSDGFVPVWSEEKQKFVLKQTSMKKEDLAKAEGRVMSAFGPREREKTWVGAMLQSFTEEIVNTPQLVVGFGEAVKDAGEGAVNWVQGKGFVADEDDFLNRFSEQLRNGVELKRIPEYYKADADAFSDPVAFSQGLGQALASLAQFGGVGKAANYGGKYLMKSLAKAAAANTGKKGAQLAAEIAMRQARYTNLFASAAGGMVINTGSIAEEARKYGIDNASAGALALGVGAIATAIEMGIGTNRLNSWLIGTKGAGTKEMVQAISRETGGDLSVEAIEKAVRNQGFIERVARDLARKIPEGTVSKALHSLDDLGGKAKRSVAGRAASTGFEEGSEEFAQSMVESTGKWIYNNFFAADDTSTGEGRFEARNFIDEKDFLEAFQEFGMGALVGGAMGGVGQMFENNVNTDRSIISMVADGRTDDILSIMQSLHDKGRYSDEQYNKYTDQVAAMDRLWREHAPDIIAAQQDPTLKEEDRRRQRGNAFFAISHSMKLQNDVDKLQTELSDLDTQRNTSEVRKKKADLEDRIRSTMATLYANEEMIKSYKDYRKSKYSEELRMFEFETNTRKGYANLLFSELKADVQADKDAKRDLKPSSKEYKDILERQKKKEASLKVVRSEIRNYNRMLNNFKRKSYRQAFDSKKLEKERGTVAVRNLVETTLAPGLRYVHESEDLDTLRDAGHALYRNSFGMTLTDAPSPVETAKETPTENKPTNEDTKTKEETPKETKEPKVADPAPEPKKDTEKKVETPTTNNDLAADVIGDDTQNPSALMTAEDIEGMPDTAGMLTTKDMEFSDWNPYEVLSEEDFGAPPVDTDVQDALDDAPTLDEVPDTDVPTDEGIDKGQETFSNPLQKYYSDLVDYQVKENGISRDEAISRLLEQHVGGFESEELDVLFTTYLSDALLELLEPLLGKKDTPLHDRLDSLLTKKSLKEFLDTGKQVPQIGSFEDAKELAGLSGLDTVKVGNKVFDITSVENLIDSYRDVLGDGLRSVLLNPRSAILSIESSMPKGAMKKDAPVEKDTVEDEPINPQDIIPNQFGSLFVHKAIEHDLEREKAIRGIEDVSQVRIKIGTKWKKQADENVQLGKVLTAYDGKPVRVQQNSFFVDAQLYIGDTLIGSLENPYKFTFGDVEGSDPIIFDEMTFEDFKKYFTSKYTDNMLELFEQTKREQAKLIELRRSLDTLFENASEEAKKGEIEVTGGMVPLKTAAEFLGLLESKNDMVDGMPQKVPYTVSDSDARDKEGRIVIFDTHIGRYVSGYHKNSPEGPVRRDDRSRYQAYVEIGGHSTWIDVTPAKPFKDETAQEAYITKMNSLFDRVHALDKNLDKDDKEVKALKDELNSVFLVMEYADTYVKFTVSKMENGKFFPAIMQYNTKNEKINNYKSVPKFKDFEQYRRFLSGFLGLKVVKENFNGDLSPEDFRYSIGKFEGGRTNSDPDIGLKFNVFGDRKIFDPKIKVDLLSVDPSKIVSTKGSVVQDVQVTEAPAKEFTSEEEIMASDLNAKEKLSALRALYGKSSENKGAKFQRIPGLRAFNSKYIIDWVTTKTAMDVNPGTLEDTIRKYIDAYASGLDPDALGLDGTDPTGDFRKLSRAAKELNALEDLENRQMIVNEVKGRMSKFLLGTDAQIDEVDEGNGTEDTTPENTWDQDLTQKGVKISKEIKQFIGMTLVPGTDHYGRKTQVLVNFDKVYGKILHNLANTLSLEEQVKRLDVLAGSDPEIAAITSKLKEHGDTSNLYRGFFTEFTKFRMDYLQTVVDKGDVNVYNGIQKDAGDILFRKWGAAHALWKDSVTEDEKSGILRQFSKALQALEYGDTSDSGIATVKKAFSSIGMDLPDVYIKGSLGDTKVREAFPDHSWIELEDVVQIRSRIEGKSQDGNINMFSEEGERGKIQKIADNAVGFTEDAFESTLVDAENKRRYAFVSPNYLIESISSLIDRGTNENTGKVPHNYLLQKSIKATLGKMKLAFVGDIRVGNKGKVFKNNTDEDFLINRYALFNSLMLKGNTNKAVYQPFVIAEKRSSYGITLPVDFSFADKGRVTNNAVNTYFDTVFTSEYNRIKEIQADPEVGKRYNYKFGISPFAFLTALNSNKKFVEKVLGSKNISEIEKDAKKALRSVLESVVNETYNEVEYINSKEQFDPKVLQIYSNGNRKASKSELRKNMAAVFALNDMLIRASVSELVQGDAAITKNEVDRVKRAAGMNAAGVAVVSGNIRVAYKTDADVKVDPSVVNSTPVYDKNGKVIKPTSASDDAVVYVTARYRKRMEKHLGRLTPEQELVYNKIINGEALTSEEANKVDLISAKTVYYTPEIYNKKSDVVLTREWVNLPGNEKLRNMLDWMEANNVDQLITLNATKGVKNDAIEDSFFDERNFDLEKDVPMITNDKKKKHYTQEDLHRTSSGLKGDKDYVAPGYFETTLLDGSKERLQVENHSKSAKGVYSITHPSQAVELIAAELSNVEGEKDVNELMERFDKLRAEVLRENVNIAMKYLSRKDAQNNPQISDFITKAIQTLESAQEKEQVLQYLEEENGTFKYNMNLPHVRTSLKKILVSHFNKGVLVDKMFGGKVTIIPSSGIQVVTDKEGNLQDPLEVLENPEKFRDREKYDTRPLKIHGPDEDGNTAVAEIMITRRTANMQGLKVGDTISPGALDIFGVRIPSQWYHSMVAAKVVGFLPDTHGDIAALPRELPLIAGEDFDVDSRFLMIKKGYWSTDKDGNRQYKIYGDAKTKTEKWNEYYRHNAERKEITISAKNILEHDEDYLAAMDSLKETKAYLERLFEVQETLWEQNQEWYKDLQDTYKQFIFENDTEGFQEDFVERLHEFQAIPLKYVKETSRALKDNTKTLKETRKYYKDLKDHIKALRQQAVLDAFASYGLETSEDALAASETAINEAAHKNEIISTYIEMFRHKSIQDRLKIPASVDRLVDESKYINGLFDNLDAQGEVLESQSMLISPVGMFNSWRNNVAGASNIAPVASTNIFVAYATKNNLKVKSGMGVYIDGTEYGDFGTTREDDFNGKTVMEDTNFKWDSISTLITAMTDNAKERLASKLNLRTPFISPATIMLGLGIGMKRTMLFMNQPALREMEFTGSAFLDPQKITDEIDSLDAVIHKAVGSKKLDVSVDGVSSLAMQDSIAYNTPVGGSSKYQEAKANVTQENVDMLWTQRAVLAELLNVINISTYGFKARNVLSVKQGFKDTDTPSKVIEDYNTLSEPSKKNPLPALSGIFARDSFVSASMSAAHNIQDIWGRFLISESVAYRKLMETQPNLYDDYKESFVDYLAVKAFRETFESANIRISEKANLLYPALEGETLADQYDRLYKNSESFRTNPFVQSIEKSTVGKGKKVINVLSLDTFNMVNESLSSFIAEGFEELWNSDIEEERDFAVNSLFYLIQKDNFKFKKGSFVNYLAPDMIEGTLKRLDNIQGNLSDLDGVEYLGRDFDAFMQNLAATNPRAFKKTDISKISKFLVSKNDANGALLRTYKTEELSKEGKDGIFDQKYTRIGDSVYVTQTNKGEELLTVTLTPVKKAFLPDQETFHLTLDQIYELSDKLKDGKTTSNKGMDRDIDVDVDTHMLDNIPDDLDVNIGNKLDSIPDDFDPFAGGVMDNIPEDFDPFAGDSGVNIPDADPFGGSNYVQADPLDDYPIAKPAPKEIDFDITKDSITSLLNKLLDKKVSFKKFLETVSPESEYKALAEYADSLGLELNVVTSNAEAFGIFYPKGIIQINKRTIALAESAGTYDLKSMESTLVHEMIHGIISKQSPIKNKKMREELTKFIKDLSPYVSKMSDRVKEMYDYAQGDPEELVTYAFTNDEFAEFLNGIEVEAVENQPRMTFWQRLKQIILDRLPKSMVRTKMDELSDVLDTVFGSTLASADESFDMSVFNEPKFEAVPSKPFSVQEKNLESITSGQKILSFRSPKDARNIHKGDTLDITVRSRNTGIKVEVTNVHPVQEFSSMPQKRKDEMARMLGDYKDYADMLKSNNYLDPNSRASALFPEFSNFLLGKAEGVFVQYKVLDENATQIIERAKKSNPALDPHKKLLEDAQVNIQKQIDALENSQTSSVFKTKRMERLQGLLNDIEKTDDLLSISGTLKEDLQANKASLENIIKEINDGKFKNPIKVLFLFRRLVKGYDFLDDINQEMKRQGIFKNNKADNKDALLREMRDAITLKEEIESMYLTEVEPFIAKKLSKFAASNAVKQIEEEIKAAVKSKEEIKTLEGISDAVKAKRLKKANARIEKLERTLSRAALDEEGIIALMRFSEKDPGFLEYYLGASSQSSDPIVALFSVHAKDEFETSRRDTIATANKLQKVYDKFKEKYGGSISMKKVYGDMVEERNGKMYFISKYDEKAYKADMLEFVEKANKGEIKAALKKELDTLLKKKRLYDRQRDRIDEIKGILNDPTGKKLDNVIRKKFHEANNVSLDDKAIKRKLVDLDERFGRDYTVEWAMSNMNGAALIRWKLATEEEVNDMPDKYVSKTPKYYNELSVRKDKYIHSAWSAMYDSNDKPINEKGELHKALVDTYLDAQAKLPEKERQGMLLPGVYKEVKDRVFEGQNILDVVKGEARELKDNLFGDNTAEDLDYGSSNIYGGVSHDIPIYFRNNIDAKDTSIDLLSSVLKYTDMVNTFQARSNVMETGMFLIDKMDRRSMGVQTSWMKNSMDKVAERLNIKKQHEQEKGTSNAQKRLEKFVEMVVFGNSSKEARVNNFRVDKAVSMLMQHASYSSFALPIDAMSRIFMGAAANFQQQLIQQFIEAAGSDVISPSTILRGQQLMGQYGKDFFINDFQKSGMKSLVGQLVDRYDVIQGEFKDKLGNNISGSALRKLMSSESLFVHRYFTEAEPQIALFLGILDKTKVKYKGEEISLLKAYELDSNGVLQLKQGVEWSGLDEVKLMNHLHGLNKKFNGVYNSFDKSVLEQVWWGRALMFFRKYLYPSLRRRWSDDFVDYEMDEYERGYARNFWNATWRELITYNRGIVSILKGEGYSEREKMEALKSLTSFGIGLSNMMVAYILREIIAATDDEDDIIYNYLLYNAIRMKAETWTFWNPGEFMRILRSPTILTTYIERMTKFATQLIWDPFGEYERASGSNKKGDSKLYARFVKMLVGQTHYSANPDDAIRTFESLNN